MNGANVTAVLAAIDAIKVASDGGFIAIGGYFDKGGDIIQTTDGGYMAAGTSASLNCRAQDNRDYYNDIILLKLSAKGDVEWQK